MTKIIFNHTVWVLGAIDSQYTAVHYNTILHIVQQLSKKYFVQISNSWKTPISHLTGEVWVSFVSYLEKNYPDIGSALYSSASCSVITSPYHGDWLCFLLLLIKAWQINHTCCNMSCFQIMQKLFNMKTDQLILSFNKVIRLDKVIWMTIFQLLMWYGCLTSKISWYNWSITKPYKPRI